MKPALLNTPERTSHSPAPDRAVAVAALPTGPQIGPIALSRLAVWLLLAGLVAAPLAMVVSLALGDNHADLLLRDGIARATVNSLVTSGLSAAFSVVIALVLALALERTDLPGRRWIRLLSLSPMLMPPFVGAIAWSGLLGPGGSLNQLFGAPLWDIRGGDGVTFLLTVHSVPLAYLIIAGALHRVPAALEEAARISGAAPWRVFADVTFPLLRPAVLSAFTLNAVSALGDFGIPALLGLPERFYTLSTMVYRYIQSGTVEAPLQVSAQIGLLLMMLGIAGAIADYLASRRVGSELTGDGSGSILRLGTLRVPAAAVIAAAVLAVTILPLLGLALRALVPAPGIPLTPGTATLENFTTALTSPNSQRGILNSLLLAAGAALATTVLGTVIGILTTRTRSRDNAGMLVATLLPQAIPGTIIAVGWLILGRYTGLYNTRELILLAYITAFTAIVVQAVRAPLAGTPTALEEAARISGATRGRALVDVAGRLAVPAALTGGLLVALTAVRELTLSALLLAPGAQTLGVVIFNLQQAGDYNSASALSLLVAVAGLTGLALVGTSRPLR
ncbi:ABC transporter permease [Brachybacterium sp. GCM10030252]|uniref:ABC transporter permease n=1 Tax=Brachybacterium sp. GCM10030252 TaxID=3273380 RepID=UPI00361DFDE6